MTDEFTITRVCYLAKLKRIDADPSGQIFLCHDLWDYISKVCIHIHRFVKRVKK